MIIENNWAIVKETTATSSAAVVDDPCVGESASGVEVLDWKLTDSEETKSNSKLSFGGVVSEVEIGLVDGSGHFSDLAGWDPASDLLI